MKKAPIIISGAHGNLGKAVVHHFHDQGHPIIGLVHHKNDAIRLSNYREVAVDLTDESATITTIGKILREYPTIQTAILTAGGFAMGSFEKTAQADLRDQYRLNFETAYNVARPLYSHLKENEGGSLVFIGSEPGLEPAKGSAVVAYTLAKSQLFQLAKIINAKTAGTAVKALVFAPGTIDTPQNRQAMPQADFSKWQTPEAIAKVIGHHLLADRTPDPFIVLKDEL